MKSKDQQIVYPALQYKGMRSFGWHLSRIFIRLFFRVEYQGLEHFPKEGPAILVANHTSMADMLAIATAVSMDPWVCWVAKKELFSKRSTHQIFKRLACIPVDRDKTDLLAARGIFTALKARQIVGMFPQGTRVKPERIPYVRPRSGAVHFALKTGAPILPVAVGGQFRLFGKVRIVFGEPIDIKSEARAQGSGTDDLHGLTVSIMRRVYALIGVDYHLAADAGEAEL